MFVFTLSPSAVTYKYDRSRHLRHIFAVEIGNEMNICDQSEQAC